MWNVTQKKDQVKKEYEEALLGAMDSLYNLAYRMARNTDDAADLVQDAALRGFRFYDQFQKGTNFRAWIMTILRNIYINEYRKRSKEPFKISYEEVEPFVSTFSMTGFEEEVFGERVQRAIDLLSEELRTAIILYYVDGFSYREIAQVMGCPMGTVMSRLHMARQLLKKRLLESATKEA